MNQLINYQDATEQFFLDYYEQSDQSAETKVLGETVTYIQSEKEQQEHLRSRNQNLKSISLEFSPNKSKSAFFQEKVIKDSTNASRDADYVSETVVVLQQGNKTEEIFKGDFHLSNLEWLNDRELVIYRSCGTECMTAAIIDTETRLLQDMSLGVGYTWSPNKQYVAVHHYSYKYGISVADRGNEYGRRLLEIRRDHPDVGSGLTDQTTVGWSPDSSKLAVVIRKENEEKLELLVYAIERQFTLLHQQDIEQTDITNLTWEGEKNILIMGSGMSSNISF
ncbi:MAG: hypothetical protein A2632_02070 [Candidatus Pacebacteria bacterium RIFCSPHIGHO2_01_FULL_46_16]|nr:MAG: hypothetical protein A2632_02070 [Candidatus Pacebacteria bacterium RIFCSPHIGHO2_01_FULL_46_16]OGJ21584.1 MAG: hypothetical protein A3J60_03860 [Candidatus Pacebacteria bacterium RIFCSPHIGHO2_02_FULL_46_9]OGJ37386.1 MAG: hypothetical protein A3A82_02670 [Candidatus Pacebacteria bacterium RIFCSPLOWO2_01_FULL_47_12]